MPDLTPDQIAENATQPASGSVDGRSAAQVPIQDQIAAHRYGASAEALDGTNDSGGPRSGWGRLRTARAVPPGAV